MNPERWAQVEELFHRAAECEPNQRTGLLDEVCNHDPELRREVEGLLSCDGRAGDYVEAVVRSELTAVGFPLAFLIIVFWMASAAAAAWDWCTEQRILS